MANPVQVDLRGSGWDTTPDANEYTKSKSGDFGYKFSGGVDGKGNITVSGGNRTDITINLIAETRTDGDAWYVLCDVEFYEKGQTKPSNIFENKVITDGKTATISDKDETAAEGYFKVWALFFNPADPDSPKLVECDPTWRNEA